MLDQVHGPTGAGHMTVGKFLTFDLSGSTVAASKCQLAVSTQGTSSVYM